MLAVIFQLGFAWDFWHSMNAAEWKVIMVVSFIALSGYFLITKAFSLAPISAIASIEYLSLFWAVIMGYLLWNEIPNMRVWSGMALMLFAGGYLVYRESKTTPIATTGNLK